MVEYEAVEPTVATRALRLLRPKAYRPAGPRSAKENTPAGTGLMHYMPYDPVKQAPDVQLMRQEDVMAVVGPNSDNQAGIGACHNALQLLCRLLALNDPELDVYATDAVAVLALDGNNRQLFHLIASCAPALVGLCRKDDPEVQRSAAAALGNLSFRHKPNQDREGDVGAVEVLVQLCKWSDDYDVLENSAGALANLARDHVRNALRIGAAGGIETLVELCDSDRTAELDDGERVQANAGEALVNATRNDCHENAERVRQCGITPLVLLSGSQNVLVQRSAALVLGNVAQNDANRLDIGAKSGIEAIMLLADSEDFIVQANAMWALSNLAWSAANQERIGFHLPQLLSLCRHEQDTVRMNAVTALANTIFYNENNRKRLVEGENGGIALLVELCGDTHGKVRESAARALGTAAHNDHNAREAGRLGAIEALVKLCHEDALPQVQRYASFALSNIALQDPNKNLIVDANGIEALTHVCGSESHEARQHAQEALTVMGDVCRESDLEEKKANFGPEETLALCKLADNPGVQGIAADTVAEKVWCNENAQRSFTAVGAAEILQALTVAGKPEDLQIRAMWAVRALITGNRMAQSRFGDAGGVETMIARLRGEQCVDKSKLADLQEAALAVLVPAIVDHEVNCRRVLNIGLDTLIEIVESQAGPGIVPECGAEGGGEGRDGGGAAGGRGERVLTTEEQVRADMAMVPAVGERPTPWKEATAANSSLAVELLQMIGPYNYNLCKNCGTRQSGGTTCAQCAHPISFAV